MVKGGFVVGEVNLIKGFIKFVNFSFDCIVGLLRLFIQVEIDGFGPQQSDASSLSQSLNA